jgi:Kef-type K+ transport system membrane component KefB
MLIISSAMINDLIGWLIFSVVLGMIGKGHQNMSLLNTVMLTIGFTAITLTLGRGLINRALPWVNKKMAWPGGVLSLVACPLFFSSSNHRIHWYSCHFWCIHFWCGPG